MRLTRRGYAVVGVVVLALALGAWFGERALNAIVAPAVVALALAAAQAYRADEPSVERIVPAPGFPGDVRTVRLNVDVDGTAVVRDRLGDGLSPRSVQRTIAGETSVEYEVELRERGAHDLGPVAVTVRDVFGLVTREFDAGATGNVLVYPRVVPLGNPGAFAGLVDREGSRDRQAFDALREYVSGDSLRDVHWKTSAKRGNDDLVVMEFAAEDEGGVAVVGEAPDDGEGRNADAMAEATASVVAYLLDHGVEVELAVPAGSLDPGLGDRHRREVLELLAVTPPGRVSPADVEDAEVVVTAEGGEATVEVLGQTVPFDRLTGEVAAREVVA